MFKYLSLSNRFIGMVFTPFFVLPLTLFASCMTSFHKPYRDYSEYVIRAVDSNDKDDVKWRDYLKNHLQKRAADNDCVFVGDAQDDSQLQVEVDFDPNLKTDFAITVCKNLIRLKARSVATMLWLQYQFIAEASSDDSRFATGELPPSTINCKQDTAGSFAFEYRGVYSPSNSDADMMPILGLNNVDFDWGLWGHNIKKIFTDVIPQEAKALVDGVRSNEQFCFSSEKLYKAYENFVIDNYGDGSDGNVVRFAVMPNDNNLVCLCEDCRKAGNSQNCATPAVTNLVERLAKRFPNHLFFTSAYSTTAKPAQRMLPSNVGVLISASDLPFSGEKGNTPSKITFENSIRAWKRCTKRIYVWDYMRNFDDYLTPYPCLYHLQNRLQYYKELGVSGLFLNGSGYDYSLFDDVQTYVLAQLLINPSISVEDCIKRYFISFYPTTGKVLSDYYMNLENKAKNGTLQMYAGIDEALKTYLDPEDLYIFWSKVDHDSKTADDAERSKLNEMLTGLAYTKLELLRQKKNIPEKSEVSELVELLSHHSDFDDLANYRESEGDIDEYLFQWENDFPWLAKHGALYNTHFICQQQLDGQNIDVLTDGKKGFVTDYHEGWLITGEPLLQLKTDINLPENTKFKLSFMHAPKWHIYAPSMVEIWQGNECKGRVVVVNPQKKQRVDVSIIAEKIFAGTPVEIRIIQSKSFKGKITLACDEIDVE